MVLTLQELSEQLEYEKQNLESLEHSQIRQETKSKLKSNQSLELNMNKTLKELTSIKQDLSTNLSNLVDDYNSLDKQIEELSFIEDDEEKNAVVYVLRSFIPCYKEVLLTPI